MKNVLIATDLSERSEPAMRRAAVLALATGAQLHVIHVVDDALPPEFVAELSEHARSWLARHLPPDAGLAPPDVLVRVGDPHEQILAAADAVDADLIVLGSHRRRLLRDEFVGTTAERLLRVSQRSVLVVHQSPIEPYLRVLVAVDFSDASAEALRAASILGVAPGPLELVHVFTAVGKGKMRMAGIDPATFIETERVEAGQRLVAFLAAASVGDIRISNASLREGRPALEILAAANDQRAQLLVLGARGISGVRRAVLGSVSAHVIRSASCDVLAVPSGVRR